MRHPLALALLTGAIVAGPAARAADACACGPLPMPERLTTAAEAFTGRIVSLQTTGGIDVLRVRVDRVLKGTVQPTDVVSVAVTRSINHPVPRAVGQRWMLFAFRDTSGAARRSPRGRLMTSDCAGNWRITSRHPAPDPATLNGLPRPAATVWTGPSLPDPSAWIVPSLIAATRP